MAAKVVQLEEWLTLTQLALRLNCSKRYIEARIAEGRGSSDPFPAPIVAGKRQARQSEVEQWLERHGHIRRDAA